MKIKRHRKEDIGILALLTLGAAIAAGSEHHHPFALAESRIDPAQVMDATERRILEPHPSADIQILSVSSQRFTDLDRSESDIR